MAYILFLHRLSTLSSELWNLFFCSYLLEIEQKVFPHSFYVPISITLSTFWVILKRMLEISLIWINCDLSPFPAKKFISYKTFLLKGLIKSTIIWMNLAIVMAKKYAQCRWSPISMHDWQWFSVQRCIQQCFALLVVMRKCMIFSRSKACKQAVIYLSPSSIACTRRY